MKEICVFQRLILAILLLIVVGSQSHAEVDTVQFKKGVLKIIKNDGLTRSVILDNKLLYEEMTCGLGIEKTYRMSNYDIAILYNNTCQGSSGAYAPIFYRAIIVYDNGKIFLSDEFGGSKYEIEKQGNKVLLKYKEKGKITEIAMIENGLIKLSYGTRKKKSVTVSSKEIVF